MTKIVYGIKLKIGVLTADTFPTAELAAAQIMVDAYKYPETRGGAKVVQITYTEVELDEKPA